LTTKEVYELREMLRLTGTKESRFSDEGEKLSLSDAVKKRIEHVINNEVLVPPYISAVTVHQVMYDGGIHWSRADDVKVKMGLLQHAGVSRPPNWYLAEQGKRFGYIMDWPPIAIRSIVTGTMRSEFLNPILDGTNFKAPYIIGYCKGYISEENGAAKYIPEQGRFISTYFIIREDKTRSPELATYILKQPWWFRKQWLMMLEKLPGMVKGWKKAAEKMSGRADAMRLQWNIDDQYEKCNFIENLNPLVPEEMIDWRSQPDDDE
jgi:hypothetical protein